MQTYLVGGAVRDALLGIHGSDRDWVVVGSTPERSDYRHVLLLERPWTPGDAEQAEDRCHRIGMQSALQCYWLQLGVADQLVDGLIADKAERIGLLLNRGTQPLRRQALPKMVQELLDRW